MAGEYSQEQLAGKKTTHLFDLHPDYWEGKCSLRFPEQPKWISKLSAGLVPDLGLKSHTNFHFTWLSTINLKV